MEPGPRGRWVTRLGRDGNRHTGVPAAAGGGGDAGAAGARLVILAGREGLLAELDGRLARARGIPKPRVVALCGLGGAGKTSVAMEYAHRHLTEVGVCWQFAAEDPAVLAARVRGAGRAAGRAGCGGCARSGGVGACGVGPRRVEWLLVFDNVTDRAAVEAVHHRRWGTGRVLVTTQSAALAGWVGA